jgi:hypothetical protein
MPSGAAAVTTVRGRSQVFGTIKNSDKFVQRVRWGHDLRNVCDEWKQQALVAPPGTKPSKEVATKAGEAAHLSSMQQLFGSATTYTAGQVDDKLTEYAVAHGHATPAEQEAFKKTQAANPTTVWDRTASAAKQAAAQAEEAGGGDRGCHFAGSSLVYGSEIVLESLMTGSYLVADANGVSASARTQASATRFTVLNSADPRDQQEVGQSVSQSVAHGWHGSLVAGRLAAPPLLSGRCG